MKFKGQTIKGPKRQYSLKQQLGQGGFSVIYLTSQPEIICKVQVLSSSTAILHAYRNEKQALQQLQHKNIVLLKQAFELKQKNQSFGFIFMQNCNAGNAFNILESYGENNDVPEKQVLKIAYSISSALEYMHKKQIAHRDIKLENVLVNAKGEYKLCDFGSSSKQIITDVTKQNRADIEEYIEKTTTPLYRSPEQLDLYAGYQIGVKVDVFALGVLMFMLCFKKQPFESRLSAINKQFFIPEQTSYSSQLVQLISKCFVSNPKERLSASQAKKQLQILLSKKVAQLEINLQRQLDSTLTQILKITPQMLKKSSAVTVSSQSSIFDKIKRMYNQMTTETEGWISGFIEDNLSAPQLKYNRSIISKCWEKRYKSEKMYELLGKYADENKGRCLVNIKLMILTHNFLRKGPPEAVSYDGKDHPGKLCSKVYKNWKMTQRAIDSDDVKRNSYVCLVIRYYTLVLVAKWKLCYENSDIIEGNFSILPFFQSKNQIALLKLPFICDLLKFLQTCVQFHEILSTHSYLIQIQRSIILSLVDEQYCCISLLVFLICGFKQAICHLQEELDLQKLQKKLRQIQNDFQEIFTKLKKLFESANKLASLFENDTPFLLNAKILQRIKSINIREKKKGNFEFKKHINYEKSIQGLKIPLSYEQAIKNPNFLKNLQKKDQNNVIEMNQFKIKKVIDSPQNNKQQNNKQPPQKNGPAVTTNQAFKKNKQNKIFTNQDSKDQPNQISQQKQKPTTNQSKNPQIQSRPSNKNPNLMQFTHQNLNADMNSDIKKNQSPKGSNNQFRDFLSIVDEKFNNSMNNLAQNTKPIVAVSKLQPINKDIFSSYNNLSSLNDSKSKISSVYTNTYQTKGHNNMPNLFTMQQPFMSTNSNIPLPKGNSNFDAFDKIHQGQILNNQIMIPANKNFPNTTFKKTQNESSELANDKNKDFFTSVSKQVYNTLNNTNSQQQKKVELMNFFDDQEDTSKQQNTKYKQGKSQQIPTHQASKSSKNISFQNHHHNVSLLNRTGGPEQFRVQNNYQHELLHHNNSSKELGGNYLQVGQKQNNNANNFNNLSDQRLFKTSPNQHSFIDLKGFIVQEVKKNAQQYFIQFPSLKFFNKVGYGHSSQVFKGQWRGRQVAIKRIKDNMSPSNAKQFRRQIMTSVKIRHHPNLVTLIGIAEYQNEYYIINEFCTGATLFDFLHESNCDISINVKISIAKQIAKGMVFLHTNDPPIIHRDLKSLNVLLVNKYNGQAQPQIKIADFGLSRDFASTYMTGTLGTYHWMAPEIFNNEPYSLKADVYSYAIVLWEILSRSPPYTNIKNPQSLMKFIALQNGRPDMNLITTDCPYELKMLMLRCWDRFPQNRPSFKQILQALNSIQPT